MSQTEIRHLGIPFVVHYRRGTVPEVHAICVKDPSSDIYDALSVSTMDALANALYAKCDAEDRDRCDEMRVNDKANADAAR